MLVSYNWLNKYFAGQLPNPEVVADKLTFHAWEIEDVKPVGDDTVLDISVLPDKAMWALSHRGIAKDLSVILDLPLATDPLEETVALQPTTDFKVDITDNQQCRRFASAHLKGVKVGESPQWLQEALRAIGQKSINNIVDASNYVMFDLGQPSHAFDADLIGKDGLRVRHAKIGETLLGLDDKEYTLDNSNLLITRGDTDEPLSVAGIKGGRSSGVSEQTTDLVIEAANWDSTTVRKVSQQLRLRTDASSRYENGITPEMVPYGLKAVVELVLEIAGGKLVGYTDTDITDKETKKVTVGLDRINSVLGIKLTLSEVETILNRFGWDYESSSEYLEITAPFWRTDLNLPEDIIEEIGRIYGYEHIPSITPGSLTTTAVNKRFYYSEQIRDILTKLGWSEVYTSSFRSTDKIKLANALASDKGYLRSSLVQNIEEALTKNTPNADLLGLRQIKIFEIGTVFTPQAEKFVLTLGARSPSGYKAKLDDSALQVAVNALNEELGLSLEFNSQNGVLEFDLEAGLAALTTPSTYQPFTKTSDVTYQPFSSYPAISRDIALWTEKVTAAEVEEILNQNAGELLARTTLFDEFSKDGRTSYAFRLVFQANDRTLTDSEVNEIMERLYKVVKEKGWEVR